MALQYFENKLTVIIFSFDRAAQLEALLESYYKYFSSTQKETFVLYNASNEDHDSAYELLKKMYPHVNFEKENICIPVKSLTALFYSKNLYRYIKFSYLRKAKTDFKCRLESILKRTKNDLVMFLTDDSFFVSTVHLYEKILKEINKKKLSTSYSLRLGYNLSDCPMENKNNEYGTWNFYNKEFNKDWVYPFSVDGVIYSKHAIQKIIQKVFYVNPNSFEGFVVEYVKRHKYFVNGFCNSIPMLISLPLNKVQSIYHNESMGISNESMNKFFLQGFKLKYVLPHLITTFQVRPTKISMIKGENEIDLLNEY